MSGFAQVLRGDRVHFVNTLNPVFRAVITNDAISFKSDCPAAYPNQLNRQAIFGPVKNGSGFAVKQSRRNPGKRKFLKSFAF
jgi:hypothetical protein